MIINKANIKKILANAKKINANTITINSIGQTSAEVIYSCNGGLVKTVVPVVSTEENFSATFIPISSTLIKEDANIIGDACSLSLNGIELPVPCSEDDIIENPTGEAETVELTLNDFMDFFPSFKSKYELFLKFDKKVASSLKFNEDILSVIKTKINPVKKPISFGITSDVEKIIRDVFKAQKELQIKVLISFYPNKIVSIQMGDFTVVFRSVNDIPIVSSVTNDSEMILINKDEFNSYLNSQKSKKTLGFISLKISSGKVVASDSGAPNEIFPIPAVFPKSPVNDISLKTTINVLSQAMEIMDNESDIGFYMDFADKTKTSGKITFVSPKADKIIIIGAYSCQ